MAAALTSIVFNGRTWGIGAHAAPADVESAINSGYKSWLQLNANFSVDQCNKPAIEAAGIRFAQVPVDVPNGLTKNLADNLVSTLNALPSPVMIQCATQNRASAVLALYLGKSQGWTPAQTMEWASQHNLKFLSVQPLRNWVAASISAFYTPADQVQAGVLHRQLFEQVSSTYTYLIADPVSREAVLIDPVVEKADRDAALVRELGLKLVMAINTHVHADHTSGTAALKKAIPGLRSGIAAVSGAAADVCLIEGDAIYFGSRHLKVLSTPGHTDGCLSFVMDDNSAVYTGDALLIRGCGRTDFQQGSSERLYSSITGKLFTLPASTIVYPGHDYNGNLRSSIGEEMALNNRLGYGRTMEQFKGIMAGLNLPAPKQLDTAVPNNMHDGHNVSAPSITSTTPMEAGRTTDALPSSMPPFCDRCRQDGGELAKPMAIISTSTFEFGASGGAGATA